jgi:hypothetical protein
MWTVEQLDLVTSTGEVHVSSPCPDGTYSPGQTIWAVAVDGDVYIRSTDGPIKAWYRAARNRGAGRLQVGSTTFDVTFTEPTDDREPVDAEYRRKYRHSPAYNVNRAAGSTATLDRPTAAGRSGRPG